uniref:Uncharacterized protein n=1 Tax=Chelydra serpentina TaxID=8475 RepID=A0A8C3S438_CHESE
MAKSEPRERNYDNMVKMLEDLNRDLEKLLEEMEKLSGAAFFWGRYRFDAKVIWKTLIWEELVVRTENNTKEFSEFKNIIRT